MNLITLKKIYLKNSQIFSVLIKAISLGLLVYIILDFIFERIVPSFGIISILFILISIIAGRFKKFIKDWWSLFLFFFLYEFSRGHAQVIQEYLNISANQTILLKADELIFGKNIPVFWLQPLIKFETTVLDYLSFFIYTSHYWVSLSTAILLWFKSKAKFLKFKNTFLTLCLISVITYIIFPTNPPWLTAQQGLMDVLKTETWGRLWVGSITLGIENAIGSNPVAAFPSMHVGWSLLAAYFYDQFFKNRIGKFSKVFYLYPILMCLVITYTSDHYVVDMIGGVIYVIAALWIVNHFSEIKQNIKKLVSIVIK